MPLHRHSPWSDDHLAARTNMRPGQPDLPGRHSHGTIWICYEKQSKAFAVQCTVRTGCHLGVWHWLRKNTLLMLQRKLCPWLWINARVWLLGCCLSWSPSPGNCTENDDKMNLTWTWTFIEQTVQCGSSGFNQTFIRMYCKCFNCQRCHRVWFFFETGQWERKEMIGGREGKDKQRTSGWNQTWVVCVLHP